MSASAPGIRDVAVAAGVSVTTVSDALNGKGRISPATRDRVHRVAQDLGYRPSSLARSLRAGRSQLLGVLVTKYGQTAWTFTRLPYFANAIDAAMNAALDRGYALTVLPADSGADFVLSFPLDGLLVLDPLRADPIVAAARRRGMPVVADRANAARAGDPWVDFDHEEAVTAICDHLSGDRDRAPVLLTSDGDDAYTAACRAVYEAWCRAHGREPVVVRGTKDLDETRSVVRDLLASTDHPDAVIGLEDYHAPILAEEAHRAGLRSPEDVRVGCFTESADLAAGLPTIAQMTVSAQAQGSNGVALLVDAIEGRPVRPELRLVPSALLDTVAQGRSPVTDSS
ncbi:LacI family DNA-binding transcriptional regulator [Ruania zhangjianzhongii]|uniref:LacI family DNA-binding transcriptional regulator n=1 Tax=Ruania zhangjianzhongii TaxID=2603206 RepID=UPI00143CCAFB|nr:LacI family DNA-binding transcriptional regulator [Ruania zhangjianzhongii]